MKTIRESYEPPQSPTPSERANHDTLKLLLIHPRFQPGVLEIRARTGIPPGGFKKDEQSLNETLVGWQQKIVTATDQYMASNDFRNELKDNFSKWETNQISYDEKEKSDKELNAQAPLNVWRDSIDKLLSKFGLHENFRNAIEHYVLTDEMEGFPSNYLVVRSPIAEPKTITIELLAPVSQNDEMPAIIRRANTIMNHLFPSFWKHRTPLEGIDGQIALYKAWHQKKSYIDPETDEEIKPRFSDLIDSETLDDQTKKRSDTIRKAIQRLEEKLKERFPADSFDS